MSNEFTKEELEEIMHGLSWGLEGLEDTYRPLIDKLQSLIDNYCECVCTEGSGKVVYCGKCGISK